MIGSTASIIAVTVALIFLSGFFVAVEFSLIAAKRHRLEDAAGVSASARAALRSSSELTLLLAGSQLGITVCTLTLGAVTEPALHHWLTPGFAAAGLPEFASDAAGFVVALIIVTFLHLVVGEMAPKSWAIAHPERSATMLAIPMRMFMWVFRPLLRALNAVANWLVRKAGIEPTDHIAASQSPSDLRHLVEHSANVGALDAEYVQRLSGALEMQFLTVGDLVGKSTHPVVLPQDATVADVRDEARRAGHLRILIGKPENVTGVIHVRDTLLSPGQLPAAPLARPVFTLDASTALPTALSAMRETSSHLAIITTQNGYAGLVTLTDVLAKLLPQLG